MVSNKMRAKDVEMYIFTIDDTTAFDPEAKGNDETVSEYVDAAITAGDITNFTKVSDKSNEFGFEPSEDDTETKNYYGSTTSGAQNSESYSIPNNEVDVSFNVDTNVQDDIIGLTLTDLGDTNATVTGYESYNLGAKTSDVLGCFVRIKRLIGSTYYFRNIVMSEVSFLNVGAIAGAPDDAVLTNEYNILSNKSNIILDMYNHTADETTVNF